MSDTQLYCSLLVLLPSAASRPFGVTATRNGYNSALISWTAPSRAPAGYEVFYSEIHSSNKQSAGNTTSTMMTVTGLSVTLTYYIFVVSFGEEGTPVLPSRSNTVQISLGELNNYYNYYTDTHHES